MFPSPSSCIEPPGFIYIYYCTNVCLQLNRLPGTYTTNTNQFVTSTSPASLATTTNPTIVKQPTTQANDSQRRPMKVHDSHAVQRRPTAANEGQRRPMTTSAGQREPTK